MYLDIEVILLSLPTLEKMELSSGLDAGDRQDATSSREHEAKLRHLVIVNRQGYELGPQNICWLVSSIQLFAHCEPR